MGIFILCIILIVEITFLIYALKTRNNQTTIRNIIRVSAFGNFLLFGVIQVITWSFRYVFFAIVLMVYAILGIIGLIRKKVDKKNYTKVRIIRKTIGSVLLLSITIFPAIFFPQYEPIPESGELDVAMVNYTYTDKNRIETYDDSGENRKLNVEFWYPEDGTGSYPLIIFSHGMYGVKYSNESLFRELASNGYVVCSIDHTYHSFFTEDDSGKITIVSKEFLKQNQIADEAKDAKTVLSLVEEWMKIRTDDMNFVIDTILENVVGNSSEAVYNRIDNSSIGICGHSMGGATALGVGRQRTDIQAVMSLEAPYFGDIIDAKGHNFIFTEDEYPIPVLNIYSDGSWGFLKENTTYAQNERFLNDADSITYNVYLKGAGHMTLTDLSLFSPILSDILQGGSVKVDARECLETINELALNYFECYLKGVGSFNPQKEY
jgi:dienelactone hydrolase